MFDKMQCEEYYKEHTQLSLLLEFNDEAAADEEQSNNSNSEVTRMLLISPNMLIEAQVKDGKLVRSIGALVTAEQIELNHVKVTYRDGSTAFFKLDENVRWMEVDM